MSYPYYPGADKTAYQPPPYGQPVAMQPASYATPVPIVEHCFMIKSVLNGLVLEVEANNYNPGTRVVTWQEKVAPGNDNQLWYEDPQTGTIRARLNQFVLDLGDNGTLVVNPYAYGNYNQQWIRQVDRIQNRQDANRVIEIANSNVQPSARVCVWQWSGANNQKWMFPPGRQMVVAPPMPQPVIVHPPPPPYHEAASMMSGMTISSGSGPAGAPFYIRSAMNGKVLDVSGANAAVGTPVITWPRKSPPAVNQLWYLDGEGIIRSKLNDYALRNMGGHMGVHPYDPSSNQRWAVEGNKITNRANTRRCVDIQGASMSDGARIIPADYKGTANQHWQFDYDVQKQSGQSFFIRSAMNSKVLDVRGENAGVGAQVIMWSRKTPPANNQLWYLDGEGIIHSRLNNFAFRNMGNKMCLHPYDPKSNQRWAFDSNKIINRANPKRCIDISGASQSEGATVVPFDYKGSQNQIWFLDYV